jgi:hypothetical protein
MFWAREKNKRGIGWGAVVGGRKEKERGKKKNEGKDGRD